MDKDNKEIISEENQVVSQFATWKMLWFTSTMHMSCFSFSPGFLVFKYLVACITYILHKSIKYICEKFTVNTFTF